MASKGTRHQAKLELAGARTLVTRAGLSLALIRCNGTPAQVEVATKAFRAALRAEKLARLLCGVLRDDAPASEGEEVATAGGEEARAHG